MMKILEVGSGRNWQKWIDHKEDKITCVDQIYTEKDKSQCFEKYPHIELLGGDLQSFLENYTDEDFDLVVAQRIFEHITPDQIPYHLYLIRQIISEGGKIEIVVPDFKKVIKSFDAVDPHKDNAIKFNSMMIMAHTEIFNEPNDPHSSIWTPKMAKYYLELEGYWQDIKIGYTNLDGRDWYMKIEAVRK
jgi:predicted SAM-dependent methyltransferase